VQELLREAPRHSDQPISKDDVYQSLVQQAYFDQGAAELGVLSGGTLPIEALYVRLMQLLANIPEGETLKSLT